MHKERQKKGQKRKCNWLAQKEKKRNQIRNAIHFVKMQNSEMTRLKDYLKKKFLGLVESYEGDFDEKDIR